MSETPNSKPVPLQLGLNLAPESPDGELEPSKLRILIVDDEPMLRTVIQDFLLMLGFENQCVAGDGLEALEVMRSRPIDFMLSDIRMPKMELEELLGVVRQEFPRLVVIATSGFSDLDSARNIFSKGAHDFIGKPLNLDALELALQWILERQKILQAAERLMGKSALPVPPEEGAARLDALREAIRSGASHFEHKMGHAIRIADFLRRIRTGLEPAQALDLELAALLHELGNGYQIQSLCRQPRQLDDEERRLVQEHAMISGRLVAWSLGRPEFLTIIGEHIHWAALMTRPEADLAPEERLALWLGALNSLDGILHDRPDRPGLSPQQLKASLQRKHRHPGRSPVGLLLEQWDQVEAYFSSPGAR